jgi:hypothetical protein
MKNDMVARKKLTAAIPADLINKVYAAEGWTPREGEVRIRRAKTAYCISRDNVKGVYVATPKRETK